MYSMPSRWVFTARTSRCRMMGNMPLHKLFWRARIEGYILHSLFHFFSGCQSLSHRWRRSELISLYGTNYFERTLYAANNSTAEEQSMEITMKGNGTNWATSNNHAYRALFSWCRVHEYWTTIPSLTCDPVDFGYCLSAE